MPCENRLQESQRERGCSALCNLGILLTHTSPYNTPGTVPSGFCILTIKSPSTQRVCGRAWFEATNLAPEWTPEAYMMTPCTSDEVAWTRVVALEMVRRLMKGTNWTDT